MDFFKENLPNEVWKDIIIVQKGIKYDFTNKYQVSNMGRVRNLSFNNGTNNITLFNGFYSAGYLTVYIHKKVFRIHRLVATMFIPNPNNYPQVNHKDGDKNNNTADNLEWINNKENINHAINNGLISNKYIYNQIAQYNLNGELIKIWNNISEIKLKNINTKNIRNCCNYWKLKDNNQDITKKWLKCNKYVNGFIWKFNNIEDERTLPNLPNEVWKDIIIEKTGKKYNFTNKYQISNMGRVKSLNSSNTNKEKELAIINKTYPSVVLSFNGKRVDFYIHRLVATMFIPNPNNYPQVNHKDGDKNNRKVDNLEWSTNKENINHAINNRLRNKTTLSIKIDQYDLNDNFIKTWNSAREAAKFYNLFNNSCITACCKGKQKKSAGFKWKYHNSKNTDKEEIIEFIKENYKGNIIINDSSILSNNEKIFIYIPDLKLAINYNMILENNFDIKGNYYHLKQTEECIQKNIHLIQIFENEWINKKDIVKSKLKYLLHAFNNLPKIRASKCIIKNCSSLDKNIFLNKYHLQGYDRSLIKLGLYYNDELVAIMTFCKPRKALGQGQNNINKYDYELSRYASSDKYIIYGAFNKLFKYFKNNYNWENIITYADRRYSIGNIYNKNDFKFMHYSKPNYWYFSISDHIKLIHRYEYRKTSIKIKFPDIYNDTLTEYDMMKIKGFSKIYDCGNIVYSYSK